MEQLQYKYIPISLEEFQQAACIATFVKGYRTFSQESSEEEVSFDLLPLNSNEEEYYLFDYKIIEKDSVLKKYNEHHIKVRYCLNDCQHCQENYYCHQAYNEEPRINKIEISFPIETDWNNLKDAIDKEMKIINYPMCQVEERFIIWKGEIYIYSLKQELKFIDH